MSENAKDRLACLIFGGGTLWLIVSVYVPVISDWWSRGHHAP